MIHQNGLEYYEALIPAVTAGVACNFAFRIASDLPKQERSIYAVYNVLRLPSPPTYASGRTFHQEPGPVSKPSK